MESGSQLSQLVLFSPWSPEQGLTQYSTSPYTTTPPSFPYPKSWSAWMLSNLARAQSFADNWGENRRLAKYEIFARPGQFRFQELKQGGYFIAFHHFIPLQSIGPGLRVKLPQSRAELRYRLTACRLEKEISRSSVMLL